MHAENGLVVVWVIQIGSFFVCVVEIDLVFVSGPEMASDFRGGVEMDLVFMGMVKIDLTFEFDRKLLGFGVEIEVDFFRVWVVDIDLGLVFRPGITFFC